MPSHQPGDLNQFLVRRQPDWTRLEQLLAQVEQQGLSRLSFPELREFGRLYRRASSDLIAARARTANAGVLEYLNDLVARSYSQIYRSSRTTRFTGSTIRRAWIEFPRLLRRRAGPVRLAALIMLVAGVAGWFMGSTDPGGAYHFLPAEMVRSIPALREHWKRNTGHEISLAMMTIFSSGLMVHNIGIGLMSFAGGLVLGIPTILVLVQTGVMVGVLGAGMSYPGSALAFWSLILPHGFVELTAIVILSGGGLLLASALLFPGQLSRGQALVSRGRDAVGLAAGGAAMLVVAGLIEGHITPPQWIPPPLKLSFAGLTVAAMVAYFGLVGREPDGEGSSTRPPE
ncbi:MAG: stage II sporulation protein M [Armatimonadetes bacterium]|nr:stage II sporulation protein M [Armatimonadota bacterium]